MSESAVITMGQVGPLSSLPLPQLTSLSLSSLRFAPWKEKIMLDQALFLIMTVVLSSSDPIFSRSHSQPDVDLSRPPELQLHHQSNLSIPLGNPVVRIDKSFHRNSRNLSRRKFFQQLYRPVKIASSWRFINILLHHTFYIQL